MISALFLVMASVGSSPLSTLFTQAHHDAERRTADRFADATVDTSLVGKAFRFVAPLQDGDSYGSKPGDAFFSYKSGTLRLVFNVNSETMRGDSFGTKYYVARLGGARAETGAYIGQNGFGARARVSKVRLDENTLVMVSRPVGDPNPLFAENGVPDKDLADYEVKLQVSGSEAKSLAYGSRIVIEGTIAPFRDGKLTACQATYYAPTIDTPSEIYGSDCWVGAAVTRIAFIRAGSDDVLKQWVIGK